MARALSLMAAILLVAAPSCATRRVAPPAFTTVTFERTPCFGTCPVYTVTVNGNGNGNGGGLVTFVGKSNVDSIGTFTARIDSRAIAALRQAFENANYWSLASRYGSDNCSPYGTDAARILTSLATADRIKSVDHDLGCGSSPARLPELYRNFDDIIGTSRWIGRR